MKNAVRTILAVTALTLGLAASVPSASASPAAQFSHAESATSHTGGPSGGVYVN